MQNTFGEAPWVSIDLGMVRPVHSVRVHYLYPFHIQLAQRSTTRAGISVFAGTSSQAPGIFATGSENIPCVSRGGYWSGLDAQADWYVSRGLNTRTYLCGGQNAQWVTVTGELPYRESLSSTSTISLPIICEVQVYAAAAVGGEQWEGRCRRWQRHRRC